MLKVMREKSKIFLWIVAVSFIIFMIGVWGMDLRQSETVASSSVVGEVDGHKITATEYRDEVNNLIQNYRTQNKDQEPPEDMRRQLDEQAWQSLVQRTLLRKEIDKRNLKVADAEIVSYIRQNPLPMFQQNPSLQTNGQFDMTKYQQALNDPRIDWTWLEEYARGVIPLQKLQQEVAATVRVTDDEIREKFLGDQEQVRVSYLSVAPREFRDTTAVVTDTEIETYYKENPEIFRRPEQASLAYVLFEKKPSAADEEEVKGRATEIATESKSAPDFGQLAGVYSEDATTATNGGDLGSFTRGTMVPEFDAVAFTLAPGQVSDPVKTKFGYHIIKVEEKKMDAAGQEEIHARHILLKIEPSPETVTAVYEKAQALAAASREAGIEKAAQADGLTATKTPAFGKGDFIPGVGLFKRASDFAFANPKGSTSAVLEGPRGLYVFMITERTPSGIPPLAEAKTGAKEKILLDRQRGAALARIEAVAAAIKGGKSLEEAGVQFGIAKKETPLFNRITTVGGIGRATPFTFAAFALEPGQTSGVVETSAGFQILRVEEKKPADETAFAARKEMLRQQLFGEKLNARFTEFVSDLEAKAVVKDRRGLQQLEG